MSDFASLKAEMRAAVHEAFAVDAEYEDAETEATTLRVRWHPKRLTVNPGEAGYASALDVTDRIVFDRTALAEAGITPVRNATVALPAPYSITVILETREAYDGPVDEVWHVARDA